MKRSWSGCVRVAAWVSALLWAGAVLPGSSSRAEAAEDQSGRLRGALDENGDPVMGSRAVSSPRRIGEVVNVFGTTEVRPNERASSTVTVWGDARIEGEVGGECITVFGNSTVSGKLGGECVTVFGDLDLDSEVRGEVVVVMGNARFGPNAVVHGECMVIGGKLRADPEAVFHSTKHEFAGFLPPLGAWFKYGLLLGRPLVFSLGWVWAIFALHVLAYLLVALLLPKPVAACEQAVRDQPLASFGVGLLGLFLFWPAVTIVAATGVGLLVIPFLLAATLGGIILGKTAVVQWMGRSALRSAALDAGLNPLAYFLVGVLMVTVLYLMPFIGFVTWGLLLPLGFGAAIMALVELIRQHRAKRPPPPVPVLAAPAAWPSSAAFSSPSATGSAPTPMAPPPASSVAGEPAASDTVASLGTAVTDASPPSVPGLPDATGPALATHAATGPALLGPAPAAGAAAAEFTALPRAGFWIRLAAALLDFVLMGWFVRIVDGYFPLLWLAYHVGMWTWKGTTIGGIVCGLKVVREDGRGLDFTVALVRSLASVFSFVALGLGFFWAGWSPERQSWHDKIAGTVIVKVPKGMPLI
jgi:uncharacterized RDD family membrane protein YckC